MRLIFACALLVSGCKPADADALARVGQRLGQHVRSWAPGERPDGAALARKVSQRIRDDIVTADTPVTVAADAATIRLSGRGVSEEARRKAEELAASTVGVGAVEVDWQ